ncbi:hypothetical protein SAMN05444671_3939 [Flavobacterium sp. CF108]|nr:hypothetical protein SAMN05444671_3939 [Flavobacterium sp. CF108]
MIKLAIDINAMNVTDLSTSRRNHYFVIKGR